MNLLSLVSSWLTDMCLSTSLFCIFVIVLVRLQTKCLPYQKLHLLLLVCWRLLELHVEWQQEVMHACRFSWSPSVIIIFLTILTKILCLLLWLSVSGLILCFLEFWNFVFALLVLASFNNLLSLIFLLWRLKFLKFY